ncbi:hypothetical protein [Paraburkholderia sp. 40]|uniref:hypothetical protein n=1 Tax=Paraburkholderia sp. 40 TaxID=2991059 RepID=UPI003D254C44
MARMARICKDTAPEASRIPDARIKATTLHSFKGWEGRLLVVYIAQATDAKNFALIYAGPTRLKRSTGGSWLTVVCSAPDLEEFGRKWPQFEDWRTPSKFARG